MRTGRIQIVYVIFALIRKHTVTSTWG